MRGGGVGAVLARAARGRGGGTMLRAVAAQRLRRAVSAGREARGAPSAAAGVCVVRVCALRRGHRPRGAEGSVAFPPPRPCGPVPSGAEVGRGGAQLRRRPARRWWPMGVSGGGGRAAGAEVLRWTPLLSRSVAVSSEVSEWMPGVQEALSRAQCRRELRVVVLCEELT